MRTLTGLSGEYVTFDQNGQNAASAEFGILAASLPNWRFRRINDVIPMISRTVKVRIFPYFKILNFRSGDVTFLRNAKTAIFTKNEGKNRTTFICDYEQYEIETEKQQRITEQQRTFRVATIVLLQ